MFLPSFICFFCNNLSIFILIFFSDFFIHLWLSLYLLLFFFFLFICVFLNISTLFMHYIILIYFMLLFYLLLFLMFFLVFSLFWTNHFFSAHHFLSILLYNFSKTCLVCYNQAWRTIAKKNGPKIDPCGTHFSFINKFE